MKKIINEVHIEGRVYACNLEKRVTGANSKAPGTEYIRGDLQIATDEEGLNVVPYYVTYLTQKTSKGTENATYTTLNNLLTSGKTWSANGKDQAMKVRIDCAVNVNDFIGRDETLVSQHRAEGGFVHLATTLNESENKRSTFKTDVVITGVELVEGNPDTGVALHANIKACTFDFRGALVPVTYIVERQDGIDYFLGLNASSANPVFTCVWGNIVSKNVVREKVQESAFGGPSVTKTTSNRKVWVVEGAEPTTYMFPSADTLTVEELKNAIAAREVAIASVKQRAEERKTTVVAANTATVGAAMNMPQMGEFKF